MFSSGSTVSPLSWPLVLVLSPAEIHVDATLSSGQSFCWQRDAADGSWRGWIAQHPCYLRPVPDGHELLSPTLSASAARQYFQLDFDLAGAIATFPQDAWLTQALGFAPGLRVLRQEPWETLAGFICSSVKQIVQIQQINQTLRCRFGRMVVENWHDFPTIAQIAAAGESGLRACRLGFRARHLAGTAQRLCEQDIDLENWRHLATDELRQRLISLPGVGEKIANCVLLFGYSQFEAFPVDVWVERALRQLYFPHARQKNPEHLRKFARDYFGPLGGYAQQYLFHWIRTSGHMTTGPRTARKIKMKGRSIIPSSTAA